MRSHRFSLVCSIDYLCGSAATGCLRVVVCLCVASSTGSHLMERPVLGPELRAPHTPATVGGNMAAHEGDGVSRADEPAEEHAQHGGESRPPMAVEPRTGDAEAAQIDPVERLMQMLLEQQAAMEKQRVRARKSCGNCSNQPRARPRYGGARRQRRSQR